MCTYSGLIWVKIRYELLVPGEDMDTTTIRAEGRAIEKGDTSPCLLDLWEHGTLMPLWKVNLGTRTMYDFHNYTNALKF